MNMHLAGYGPVVEDISVATFVRGKLTDAGWSQVKAAAYLGCSAKHLNEIVMGKIAVSADLAVGFERMLSDRGLAEQILMLQVHADLRERGVLPAP